MQTEQQPHQKMTDEEIKETVRALQNTFTKMVRSKGEKDQLYCEMDTLITNLKRHFLPELFLVMKISVKELSDMIAYPKEESDK